MVKEDVGKTKLNQYNQPVKYFHAHEPKEVDVVPVTNVVSYIIVLEKCKRLTCFEHFS